MRFPFVGPAYASQSLRADAQESINLYLEQMESGAGANDAVLYGTPGLQLFATLGAAARGLWGGDDRAFAVAGTGVYEISSGGSVTSKGTVANDGKPAYLYPNGTTLFIVSGGLAYVHTGVSLVPLNFIGTTDPVTASSGCFLDGYFIAAKPDSKEFYISGLRGVNTLEDSSTTWDWDGLDYATKEAYPDNIARIFADHEDLWLQGDETTEVWRNTGNADFPFERDPGAFIPVGNVAPASTAAIANGVAWLGGDRRGQPVAYFASGYVPNRISTHAIEAEWASYSAFNDAVAYTYMDKGHWFYVLSFPTGNATWVWDATTKLWHRRGYGATWARQRGQFHAYEFGKHLVTDWQNGNVYAMSSEYATDNGTAITWRRTAPHVADELKRVEYNAFRLDYEGSGQTMTLAISDDAGKNWTAEKAPSGARIARGTPGRTIAQEWRRLGTARDRLFRVTGSGSSVPALINAYINPED